MKTLEQQVQRDVDHTYPGSNDWNVQITPHNTVHSKERMYTEAEVIEAMKYASSHLSSLQGIQQWIEQYKQQKDDITRK